VAPDGIAYDFKNLLVRIAALGMSWEHTFLDGEDLTTIKVGALVAFDLDL
jgi:hypothetical protein